jgi:hypothetical protein
MRIARAGLVIGWVLVAMLAVAGFAAFSAGDDSGGIAEPGSTLTNDVGRTAGAVSALGFVGSANTTSPRSASPRENLDPTIAGAGEFGLSPAPIDGAAASDKRGGVFVRSGYLTETEVRELVIEYFRPDDVNRAIRVAWCVSAFNPAAVNPATGSAGLFQHLPDVWAERSAAAGHPTASIFDPAANVAVAAWMLYELPGGWSHWDCTP